SVKRVSFDACYIALLHHTIARPISPARRSSDLVQLVVDDQASTRDGGAGEPNRPANQRDDDFDLGDVDVHALDDAPDTAVGGVEDRKSRRLNSSHVSISYAVLCWKKKKERPHED